MKIGFSSNWKRSIQPRKQRKYRANAPLHIKGNFMHAPLSKELRKKHGIRSMRLRKGDKVKVLRGQFKGSVGKSENISVINEYVNVAKIEISKKDGSKQYYPIHPSNVIILEIESERKRQKRLQRASGKSKSDTAKQRPAAAEAPADEPKKQGGQVAKEQDIKKDDKTVATTTKSPEVKK